MSLGIVGDVFVDILAGPIEALPEWGGDRVVDRPIAMKLGGSAMNTALQCATLAREFSDDNILGNYSRSSPTLFSAIGNDALADFTLKESSERKLSAEFCRKSGDSTGTCIVISGRKDRTFISYRGCLSNYAVESIDKEKLFQNSHLHFAGYYNCPSLHQGLQDLICEAAALGITISVNPQYDASEKWQGISDLLRFLDIAFFNENEAAKISECSEGPERCAERLCEMGARLVVITLGGMGALAFDSERKECYKYCVDTLSDPVDTTGAGDSFCAGFLCEWILSGDIQASLRTGCAVGTAMVTKVGGSALLKKDDIVKHVI